MAGAKRSRPRRRSSIGLLASPRVPALDELLEELRSRSRKDGVTNVLVNSYGEPWSASGFGGSFNRIRDEAEIFYLDEESGERIRKHLHDLRGTFCTKLMTTMDLTDREVADMMGWSVDNVSTIRRVYVDQSHVVRALGERMRKFGASRS